MHVGLLVEVVCGGVGEDFVGLTVVDSVRGEEGLQSWFN